MKKRKLIILIILSIFILFSICAFIGISTAHRQVFSRADYDEYNTDIYYTYHELDEKKYPRELISIDLEENVLMGYLYGKESNQGLIVISPGHRDSNDIKLPEITYFVDEGWMVLCYDYTGSYRSGGDDLIGYIQAPLDLDAVLTFVEEDIRFSNMPIMLFGHSLGAYASTAVLQYGHNITAVVAASGFDDPKEQWKYSVKRSTGVLGTVLEPYAGIYMFLRFGDRADVMAVDGINSTDIPVLIMSGTVDEYYGGISKIYERQNQITNPNCVFQLMEEENHNGHYDYFLSDEALEYQKEVMNGNAGQPIDKFLYMEHDSIIMDGINEFYLEAIEK